MDLGDILGGVQLGHAVAAAGEQAHLDGALFRADDPVFRYPRPLIQVVLGQPVVPLGGRGEDLNDEIGRALAAHVVQLAGVAHHGQVGLHQGVHVLRPVARLLKEPDGKGGRVDPALLSVQVVAQLPGELRRDLLMDPGGGRHHYRGAVDQLGVGLVVPGQGVSQGVTVFLGKRHNRLLSWTDQEGGRQTLQGS